MNRKLWLIAAIAALTAIAAWWIPGIMSGRPQPYPATKAITLFEPARELPEFSLAQSDGTRLTKGELKGHWTVVFIGFTHCPDVCPTTLAQLNAVQNAWRDIPEASRPRVLFVSVDPERDTPDAVGDYAHGFNADTLAATGDLPALEEFAQSLSMTFAKVPVEPGAPADQYSIDHTASMAVLNPQAQMAGVVVGSPIDFAAMGQDLRQLTKQARK